MASCSNRDCGDGIVKGHDRGSHSVDADPGDINALNTLLDKLLSMFEPNDSTMEVPDPEPDIDSNKYNVIIYYEGLKYFREGVARQKFTTNFKRNDSVGASRVIDNALSGNLGLRSNAEIDSIRVVRPQEWKLWKRA